MTAFGDLDSGTNRSASSSPATPTGRLMRKTIRQPVPSRSAPASQPPRIGPAIAAIPITGPNAANAAPSWLGGKTCLMIPSPCGMRSAPNAPCTARVAISAPALGASAHAAEASVKPAMPTRNMRRRPKTSPSRPPTMSRTPNASV